MQVYRHRPVIRPERLGVLPLFGGPPSGAVASSITGTSSVTGLLLGTGVLAGIISGTSSVTASLLGTGALTDAITGTSSVVAGLTGTGALADAITGTSSVSALIAGAGALATVILGTSTVTGSLIGAGALAASITGTSIVVGTLSSPGQAASIVGTSSVVAGLTGIGTLADTISGTSSVSAGVTGIGALADVILGTSAVVAGLTGAGALADSITGTSSLSAVAKGVGALADDISGTSVVVAGLAGTGALLGAITGTSTVTLGGIVLITGDIFGVGLIFGTIQNIFIPPFVPPVTVPGVAFLHSSGISNARPALIKVSNPGNYLFSFSGYEYVGGLSPASRYTRADDWAALGQHAMPNQLLIASGSGSLFDSAVIIASGYVQIPPSAVNATFAVQVFNNYFTQAGSGITIRSDALADSTPHSLAPGQYLWSIMCRLYGNGRHNGSISSNYIVIVDGQMYFGTLYSNNTNPFENPKLQLSLGVALSGQLNAIDAFAVGATQFDLQT